MDLYDFSFIDENGSDSFINIRVAPNSSQSKFSVILDNKIKLYLNSPPVDNKANTELISFISKKFKIPKSGLEITLGLTSKNKKIKVHNVTKTELIEKFLCYYQGNK